MNSTVFVQCASTETEMNAEANCEVMWSNSEVAMGYPLGNYWVTTVKLQANCGVTVVYLWTN